MEISVLWFYENIDGNIDIDWNIGKNFKKDENFIKNIEISHEVYGILQKIQIH